MHIQRNPDGFIVGGVALIVQTMRAGVFAVIGEENDDGVRRGVLCNQAGACVISCGLIRLTVAHQGDAGGAGVGNWPWSQPMKSPAIWESLAYTGPPLNEPPSVPSLGAPLGDGLSAAPPG